MTLEVNSPGKAGFRFSFPQLGSGYLEGAGSLQRGGCGHAAWMGFSRLGHHPSATMAVGCQLLPAAPRSRGLPQPDSRCLTWEVTTSWHPTTLGGPQVMTETWITRGPRHMLLVVGALCAPGSPWGQAERRLPLGACPCSASVLPLPSSAPFSWSTSSVLHPYLNRCLRFCWEGTEMPA